MLLLFLKDQENLRREFHEFRRRLKDRPNDGFDASSEADFEQILIELDQLQEAYTAELQRRRDLVSPAKGSAAVSRVDRETRAELDRLQATFSAVLERQRNRGGNSRIAGPSLEKIPFEITTEDLICYVEGSLRDDPARRRLIEYSICNDHEIFEEYQHLQERIFGGRSSGLENPEPALGDKKIASRSSKRDESFEGDSFIRPERIPSRPVKHLVIRTCNFLPPGKKDKMRQYAPGYRGRFTQSVKSRAPFMNGEVKNNDLIFLAESSYGVFALCRVHGDPILHTIGSIGDLEGFKKQSPQNLQEDENYWRFEEKKIGQLRPGKSLYILSIDYEIISVDFPHFPINRPRGAVNSWVLLDRYPDYLKFQYTTTVQEYLLEKGRRQKRVGDITGITLDCRNKAFTIYGEALFDGSQPESGLDLDHTVPADILGSGLLVENIVPVEASFNRSKNNRVPCSFFYAIKELFPELISGCENDFMSAFREEIAQVSDFRLKLPSAPPSQTEKILLTAVMRRVLGRDLEYQRLFYFCNSLLFYGEVYYSKFQARKGRSDIWLKSFEIDSRVAKILKLIKTMK